MKKINVTIKGIAPLLMHKYVIEDVDTKSAKKKKVYVPAEEAEKAAYRNKDGKLCLPSTHFKMSMVKSAVDYKYEGKKTYKDIVKSAVKVEPMNIVLTQQTYEVDVRSVVIARARIPRCRPIFEEWDCSFVITINSDNIDIHTLKEILVNAGDMKGVGDNRPEFGRFEVTKWEEI